MKTMKIFLTLLVTAFFVTACNGKGSASTNENCVTDSVNTPEEVAEEVLQPIGDRAYFEVHGNVKTITFVKGCGEFKRGYESPSDIDVSAKAKKDVRAFVKECSITDSVTFDETGKSLTANKKYFVSDKGGDETVYTTIFYTSEYYEGLDDDMAYSELSWRYGLSYTYDSKGRLSSLGGIDCGESYEYDKENRLVKTSGGGEGGFSTDVIYKYDSDGNCVKVETVNSEEDIDGNTHVTDSSSVTYTILEKDSKGNWTKRKVSDGQVDERIITYY